MGKQIDNSAVLRFLKAKFRGAGFIDSLKIKYRSFICPFMSLIKLVEPGEKVGDVGCGSGQFLHLLSEFSLPSDVYGIEISKKLIENARKLFSTNRQNSYKFEEYDGVNFPNDLGDRDTIFLIDVLHHVPKNKQEDFVFRLYNIMKSGSRLVLKDINAANPLVYFNKIHDLIFSWEIGNEMSMEDATRLLKKTGLKIIEQDKRTMYVYPHYTIVAKK